MRGGGGSYEMPLASKFRVHHNIDKYTLLEVYPHLTSRCDRCSTGIKGNKIVLIKCQSDVGTHIQLQHAVYFAEIIDPKLYLYCIL
jgi:hypothetical protein